MHHLMAMAMRIPDYALVAEVMLFAEGFEDAATLSRKMHKPSSSTSRCSRTTTTSGCGPCPHRVRPGDEV